MSSIETADRFVALLRKHAPFVYCYSCLTDLLHVPEPELRNAAQTLARRPGLRMVLGPCSRCSEAGELLGVQIAETDAPPC